MVGGPRGFTSSRPSSSSSASKSSRVRRLMSRLSLRSSHPPPLGIAYPSEHFSHSPFQRIRTDKARLDLTLLHEVLDARIERNRFFLGYGDLHGGDCPVNRPQDIGGHRFRENFIGPLEWIDPVNQIDVELIDIDQFFGHAHKLGIALLLNRDCRAFEYAVRDNRLPHF